MVVLATNQIVIQLTKHVTTFSSGTPKLRVQSTETNKNDADIILKVVPTVLCMKCVVPVELRKFFAKSFLLLFEWFRFTLPLEFLRKSEIILEAAYISISERPLNLVTTKS